MARPAKKVEELARSIEQLPLDERLRLLERVLTPKLRLRLLVEEVRRHVRAPQREIDRVVDQAVREVRRERTRGR